MERKNNRQMKLLCSEANKKAIENLLMKNQIMIDEDTNIIIVEDGYEVDTFFSIKIVFFNDKIEELQEMISIFKGNYLLKDMVIGIKNGSYTPLKIKDICYFNAINNDVFAHMENGAVYIVKSKLYQLEKFIKMDIFFRINKSELINMQKIRLITPMFKGKLIIYLEGHKNPFDISRGNTKAFKERLGL